MKIIPKDPDLIARLQSFETFTPIEKTALEWLIEKSEYVLYDKGDNVIIPDEPVDHMQIIVEGEILVTIQRAGKTRELGVWDTSTVTGVLPFSRMKSARAYGTAIKATKILRLHRDYFVEMVNVSYSLTQALVAVMSSRIREFTSIQFQDEKLMALGKLSAGLTHELNNPASAIVRSTEELYRKMHTTPEKFKAIMRMRVSPEQTDEVNDILFEKLDERNQRDLDVMEREEAVDELMDWLEDNDVKDADEIAETFVDFSMTVADLDRIKEIVKGDSLNGIMHWLENNLSMENLICDIKESSNRIAELIRSVKAYSHMDRSMTMDKVNLHEGLKNTLIMLKHKMKEKDIQLNKSLTEDPPLINAFVGELNQVWTNIISNAIEAMERGGTLTIETYQERDHFCVDITDNGPGIPEDIRTRIFEPFFTTKSMGEGTGMGLDIVKKIIDRHHATINVRSKPGKTTFQVCFPVDG